MIASPGEGRFAEHGLPLVRQMRADHWLETGVMHGR
jgi:hypothetical protein